MTLLEEQSSIFFFLYNIVFLTQGLGKEVSKTLAELYRSFSRAAALVPTAEANICCEELCSRILSVGRDGKNKVGRHEIIIKYKNVLLTPFK